MLLVVLAGCTRWHWPLPVLPEVSPEGVAGRVMAPPNLNPNPSESVLKPAENPRFGTPVPAGVELEPTAFSLTDAITFALRNNPRLRAASAAIRRAQGQEQAAFSAFLPQVDLFSQTGAVSGTLAPGIPGPTGFLLSSGTGSRGYSETELALQWTLYDFGRTGGRYRQAVGRERIAQLQLARAEQAVEFDVAACYMDILLARAARRVQEDAVRRAQATLEDTKARQKGGVALKEDVLRADVQLSESRDALVVARQAEYDSLARMNNAMGRNASMPLEVFDVEVPPPLPDSLPNLLEQAALQRPEVAVAREVAGVAQEGRQVARAEFLPRVFVRGSVGRTDGQNIVTGWQEGAGLHIEAPLYAGGRHRGDLRAAEADIEAALADAQIILDGISLQVNLSYRAVVAARERIDLAKTAVAQSEENLRLVRVRYRNGNATPTDLVDSEAAVTRSQQRFFSSTYAYLAALARLDYAIGRRQGAFLANATAPKRLEFGEK